MLDALMHKGGRIFNTLECGAVAPINTPTMVIDSLREQTLRIKALSEDIAAIERRLAVQFHQDPQMLRVAQIPGVGLLTATAAIATMGEAAQVQHFGADFRALGRVWRRSYHVESRT